VWHAVILNGTSAQSADVPFVILRLQVNELMVSKSDRTLINGS